MHTRSFHVHSKSDFGKKLPQQLDAKRQVAHALIDKLLWPRRVDSLFMNDGTSVSYVWCYYLQRWVSEQQSRLAVWTNNYDVPMQALCEDKAQKLIRIYTPSGEFNFRFCAALGPDTNKWVRENCEGKTCILAVSALDAQFGPCGNDEDAKAIKRIVLQYASNLIVVADSCKLSQSSNPFQAVNPNEWNRWITERKGNLWVVTDIDPRLCGKVALVPHAKPSTSLEWQERNAHQLRHLLGNEHFIAIPTPKSSSTCTTCAGVGNLGCADCSGRGVVA